MKKEIVLAAVVFVLSASGGFLLGRRFPAHHYTPWKNSNLLFDDTSGKVCNPLKSSQQAAAKAKQTDPYAAYGGHAVTSDPSASPKGDIWDKTAEENKAASEAADPNTYISPCD